MNSLRLVTSFVRRTSTSFTIKTATLGLVSCFAFSLPLHAAIDETVPTPETLAELAQRAQQAKPREQCFLYTDLVHRMTEKAGKEIVNGDTDQAAATLKLINQYAHLIHVSLASDTKRLKTAEELMHHTTFKLGEFLHLVSDDNKDTVQATLKQLDQVNDELLAQVFSH
jgi:hypothetical protein